MKMNRKSLFACPGGDWFLPALIAGLGLITAGPVEAQTFATLHSFTNGSDGAHPPYASSVLSGNTLYGTTQQGGSSGAGTVFAVSANGANFATLYTFTNGGDGANPIAGLILSGNTLYGTAAGGGSARN